MASTHVVLKSRLLEVRPKARGKGFADQPLKFGGIAAPQISPEFL